MPKQPFISMPSGDPFSPTWSGFADAGLRPTLLVIKQGSGFRPASSSDFTGATITGTVSGNFTNNVTKVGVTGANGTALDIVAVSGFNSLPVFISSGNISSTSSNPVLQVGITGLTGTGLDIINASGYRAIPVVIASGNFTSSVSNPVLQVGITGLTGTGLDIVNASGYRAIPVILASGSISASISNNVTRVGITGSNGLSADIATVSGYQAIPVFIVSGQGAGGGASSTMVQGVSGSGVSGNMPNPVLGGSLVDFSTASLNDNTLTVLRSDIAGNLWVALANSLSDLVDSMATRPKLPNQNITYSIPLTGVGVFSNYSSSIPALTGNVIVMSLQPHSSNNQSIYYSFSGTASTGNSWEIRGDRTIEVDSNTNVFFAQATGNQIVNVHVQVF